MSKQYKVKMAISTEGLTPNGGLIMKPKNVDEAGNPQGFEERSGAEVFAYIVENAIKGANQRVSYDQLKGFRKVSKLVSDSVEAGEFIANKTDIDIIKNSIRGNMGWPNTDEVFNTLENVLSALDNAELLNGDPQANAEG